MAISSTPLQPKLNVPQDQAIRKSMRRLRWFRSTFEDKVKSCAERTGIEYGLNSEILTACFLNWLRTLEQSKPQEVEHRAAFVGYGAGQMLKNLLVQQPLSVKSFPQSFDSSLPEYFWPQGFVYVSYCLEVRQSVLETDFGVKIKTSDLFEDLATWWSFKENVDEMPGYAVPFLDLFSGEVPSWNAPDKFNGQLRTNYLNETGLLPVPNNPNAGIPLN